MMDLVLVIYQSELSQSCLQFITWCSLFFLDFDALLTTFGLSDPLATRSSVARDACLHEGCWVGAKLHFRCVPDLSTGTQGKVSAKMCNRLGLAIIGDDNGQRWRLVGVFIADDDEVDEHGMLTGPIR